MRRRRSAGHVNGNLFDLVAANASPLADRLSAIGYRLSAIGYRHD